MIATRRSGVSRIGILFAVVILCAALGIGAFYAHKYRKANMVERALETGLQAFEEGDWSTARKRLGQYVAVHRDDADVLMKYAEAQLAVDPLPSSSIAQAIGAYRQVLRIEPRRDDAFDRLTLLYRTTENFAELGHIAKRRLEVLPDDPAARLAQCRVSLARQEHAEAREGLEALVAAYDQTQATDPAYIEAAVLLAEAILWAGDDDAAQQTLAVLEPFGGDTAEAALVHAFRAMVYRGLAARDSERAAEYNEQARAELRAAAAHDAPRALLAVTQEWTELNEFERADEILQRARNLPQAVVRETYIDPSDWRVSCYMAEAELCLFAGWDERGRVLAEETLAALEGQRQYVAILPMSVRLLVAADAVDRARICLDEYIDRLTEHSAVLLEDPSVALLQALVASAEGDGHAVIELLEPLIRRGQTNPVAERLLADAYAQTGQPGRMAAVLAETPSWRQASGDLALRLARASIAKGAWSRALDLLTRVGPVEGDSAAEVALLRASARLGQARQAGKPEQVKQELDALRALRAQHPQRSDIRIVLAGAYEFENDVAAAQAELESAIAETSDALPAFVALANLHLAQGDGEAALRVLRAACEQHGEQARPWMLLASQLIARGALEEAQAALLTARDAVADADARRQIEMRLATLDVLRGDTEAGIEELLRLAEAAPENVEIRNLLLQAPEALPDEATAQRLVDELRAIEGETGLAWREGQARVWLSQPDWAQHVDELETLLEYCIDTDPSRAAPVLLLGEAYERQARFADAERVYAASLSVADNTSVIDRMLALMQRQERYAEARELLDRLQARLSEELTGARRVALALTSGDRDEAIAALRMRTSGDSSDPDDLIRLASLTYARDGDAARAMEHLDEALERGAAPADVARVRVAILMDQGQAEAAEQLLDELVAQGPTPPALLLRAAFFLATGSMEGAEADYQRLAEISDDAFGYAALGEFHARQGRLDQAIAEWEQGLTAYPDSLRLRRGLCKALLLRNEPGDLDRMGELLSELRDLKGTADAEWLWLSAAQLEQQGLDENRTAVLERLRDALSAIPEGGPEVFLEMSELAVRLGDLPTARALVSRGLEVHRGDLLLRAQQARVELLVGDVASAAIAARELLDDQPGNITALQVLVAAAAQSGNRTLLEGALPLVEDQAAAAPNDPQVQMLLAETRIALGRLEEAASGLASFVEDATGDARRAGLLRLARMHQAAGDLAAATSALDAAAATWPDDPDVRAAWLELWGATGQYDKLAEAANALVTDEAAAPRMLLMAAIGLAESPAHAALAGELCDRVMARGVNDVGMLMQVGDLCYGLGDVTAAEAAYRQVLELVPDSAEAANNVAWLVASGSDVSKRELDEALVLAQAAVRRAPDDANYRDTLATVLEKSGRLSEARGEFSRVAQLLPPQSPERARTHLTLARIALALDEPAAADAYLQTALDIGRAAGGGIFGPSEERAIAELQKAVQNK